MKTPFVDELLHRVSTVVPLHQVDYIVVNHIEPDHNSGLGLVMEAMPQASVVATRSGGVRGVALVPRRSRRSVRSARTT